MFLRLQLHWGVQESTQAANAPASPWGQATQRLCAAERPRSEAGNVLGIANTCRSRLLHLDVRWRMLAGITADSNATHSLSTYGHHSAMLSRWSARH